jgi:hypothetical protein
VRTENIEQMEALTDEKGKENTKNPIFHRLKLRMERATEPKKFQDGTPLLRLLEN